MESKNSEQVEQFQISFPSQQELSNAYMPFIKRGGLWIATPKYFDFGYPVILQLKFWKASSSYLISGKVVWVTPTGTATIGLPNDGHAGLGIQFSQGEREEKMKQLIEMYLVENNAS